MAPGLPEPELGGGFTKEAMMPVMTKQATPTEMPVSQSV
jgi:hypothetical protein